MVMNLTCTFLYINISVEKIGAVLYRNCSYIL